MAEFKANIYLVPKILLLTLIKLVMLAIYQLFILHYLFDKVGDIGIGIIIFLSGIFICFESFTTNQTILRYVKYLCNHGSDGENYYDVEKFKRFVKKQATKVFKINKLIYLFNTFISSFLVLLLIIVIGFDFSFFALSLLVIFNVILYIKRFILSYLKSI